MPHSLIARAAGRPLFWIALVTLIAGGSIARAVVWSRRLPPPLPILATIPEFELVAEDGRAFGSRDLRGHVWLANFVYTRCPTICPAFTQRMYDVQHRSRNLGESFRMVTFTADPDYDTPERLHAFAAKYHASPRRWRFLTGRYDDVRRTVVEGMRVAMERPDAPLSAMSRSGLAAATGPAPTAPAAELNDADFPNIFHGTHFVLVDAELRIRGFYDSASAGVIDLVLRDIGLLANRGY